MKRRRKLRTKTHRYHELHYIAEYCFSFILFIRLCHEREDHTNSIETCFSESDSPGPTLLFCSFITFSQLTFFFYFSYSVCKIVLMVLSHTAIMMIKLRIEWKYVQMSISLYWLCFYYLVDTLSIRLPS